MAETGGVPSCEPRERIFPVIVLGMHRSGTSCLTGLLGDAGLFLGDVVRSVPSNLKGSLERRDVMVLNEAVLRDNHASWDRPPAGGCVWTDSRLQELRSCLAAFPKGRSWVVKDPRILFTGDAWRRLLPEAKYLGTFRHPTAVAASLVQRDPSMTMAHGLWLWYRYNLQLERLHERHPFPLVSFDSPSVEYLAQVRAAMREIGLRPVRDGSRLFYDEKLRHQRPQAHHPLPGKVAELYDRLTGKLVQSDAD